MATNQPRLAFLKAERGGQRCPHAIVSQISFGWLSYFNTV